MIHKSSNLKSFSFFVQLRSYMFIQASLSLLSPVSQVSVVNQYWYNKTMLHSSSRAAVRLYKSNQKIRIPPQKATSSHHTFKNFRLVVDPSPHKKPVEPKLIPHPVKKQSAQGRATPLHKQKEYTYRHPDYWRRDQLLRKIVDTQTPKHAQVSRAQEHSELKRARQKWKKREDTEISEDLAYKDKERARERSVLLTRQKSESSFILENRESTHRMMQRSRIHSARQELNSARDMQRQTEEHHRFLERKKKEEKQQRQERLDYRKAFLKNMALPVQKKTTSKAMTVSSKTLSVNQPASLPKKRTFPSISSMSLNTKKATLNSKNTSLSNNKQASKAPPAVKNVKAEAVKKLADSGHKDVNLPQINLLSSRKEDTAVEKEPEVAKESEAVREPEETKQPETTKQPEAVKKPQAQPEPKAPQAQQDNPEVKPQTKAQEPQQNAQTKLVEPQPSQNPVESAPPAAQPKPQLPYSLPTQLPNNQTAPMITA